MRAARFPLPILICSLLGAGLVQAQALRRGSGSSTEWLERLFPYTGKPDRMEHRLSRLAAAEFDVNRRRYGSVTLGLTYQRLDGEEESAQVRLFLPASLRDNPSRPVPLIHNAGYEVDEKGAGPFPWLQ